MHSKTVLRIICCVIRTHYRLTALSFSSGRQNWKGLPKQSFASCFFSKNFIVSAHFWDWGLLPTDNVFFAQFKALQKICSSTENTQKNLCAKPKISGQIFYGLFLSEVAYGHITKWWNNLQSTYFDTVRVFASFFSVGISFVTFSTIQFRSVNMPIFYAIGHGPSRSDCVLELSLKRSFSRLNLETKKWRKRAWLESVMWCWRTIKI